MHGSESETVTDSETPESRLRARVRELMPQLRADLDELVRIPSISGAGRPQEPLRDAHDTAARMFSEVGVEVSSLELPDTAPIIFGEIPAPPGAPTVLLYSHYDVVGAGDESAWVTPPFEPSERDGAVFGRGTADTKANLVAHVGALRAWDGRPPVGIKLIVEGDEETGGAALTAYPPTDPELFRCDAMLIADSGSVRPGVPTLTIALRGLAVVDVEVETLEAPQHSGQYGGAAPDALIALLHALATLHDEHGDVAVAGLRREEWTGESLSEAEFRELAHVLDDLPLFGTGGLGSRLWSGPAITVIGIDAPSVENAINAVAARARARLNVRVHPEQDADEAGAAVARHLRELRPFGIALEAHVHATGTGFAAGTAGPAYAAAREAWSAAWGAEVVSAAVGGSIPLVNSLHQAVPQAEILLTGAADGFANIHGPNERVLLDEFEKSVLAEADFFARYAARASG
jgi:acetylornithine deacetylase/succinyl-diaminopimelate desuccinylase-like protein